MGWVGPACLDAQQLSLAEDVDLATVAAMTDGFSAADLQAVCSDAQLESVHSFLAHKDSLAAAAAKPAITMENLLTAARNARPSVPDAERKKLNTVYASFMDVRKPTASKVPYIVGAFAKVERSYGNHQLAETIHC